MEVVKAFQAVGGRFKGSPGHGFRSDEGIPGRRLEVMKAFQAVKWNFRELVKKSWACTGMASQRGFVKAIKGLFFRKHQ